MKKKWKRKTGKKKHNKNNNKTKEAKRSERTNSFNEVSIGEVFQHGQELFGVKMVIGDKIRRMI